MEQPRVRAALLLALTAAAGLAGWAGFRALRPVDQAVAALDQVSRVVPGNRRVIIEVLNGSDRRGAARIATRVLRRAGFDVVYFGNAPEPADTTLVLVRRGDARPGEWLLDALGTGMLRSEPDTTRRVDLTVILGPDWRWPAGIIP